MHVGSNDNLLLNAEDKAGDLRPNWSESMAKLISYAVFVLLAMTRLASPAVAQALTHGGSLVECQEFQEGFVSAQDAGLFAVGPASCGLTSFAVGTIAIQPSVLLRATADGALAGPFSGSGAGATVELAYDFTVHGGNPGDLVPVVVHTSMSTSVTPSLDPENANIASANVNLYGVSSVHGSIINNGPGTFACDFSPNDCDVSADNVDDIALTMASGSSERVDMQIIVAASGLSEGSASASIDPFIFVDPRFAHAADYTITVADGVANAPPPAVPEPGVWALLLTGLGASGAIARRRRTGLATD